MEQVVILTLVKGTVVIALNNLSLNICKAFQINSGSIICLWDSNQENLIGIIKYKTTVFHRKKLLTKTHFLTIIIRNWDQKDVDQWKGKRAVE
jgi:hypothetical protein